MPGAPPHTAEKNFARLSRKQPSLGTPSAKTMQQGNPGQSLLMHRGADPGRPCSSPRAFKGTAA